MIDFFLRWGIDVTLLRSNRVFRALFIGRVLTVFGLSMLVVTVNVQIYALTGSSLHIALVNSVLGVCSVAGSFIGGAIADRVDRRIVILTTRGLAVFGFAALALNAMLPETSLAAIYVITACDAAIGSAGAAAFGAAIPAVVRAEELPATGAIMALSIDLGAAAAPALAGVLIARFEPALVLWVVVGLGIVSWLTICRIPALPPEPAGEPAAPSSTSPPAAAAPAPAASPQPAASPPCAPPAGGTRSAGSIGSAGGTGSAVRWVRRQLRQLRTQTAEAWAFSRRDRVVGTVLLIGFIQILFASPFVLIPEFVATALGGGSAEVGLLYSAPACGALLAGLSSGWIARRSRLSVIVVVVFTASALGVAAFGQSTSLWPAFAFLAVVGAGDVIGEILRFTIISSRTPDRLRGRITGLWQAQATVGDTLGGPLLSLAARIVGAGTAISIGGVIAAVLTCALLTRSAVRAHVHSNREKELA